MATDALKDGFEETMWIDSAYGWEDAGRDVQRYGDYQYNFSDGEPAG